MVDSAKLMAFCYNTNQTLTKMSVYVLEESTRGSLVSSKIKCAVISNNFGPLIEWHSQVLGSP